MTHRLFKYFLFSILLTANLYSQILESIEINGNSQFRDSQYFEWMAVSNGDKYFNGIEDSIAARIGEGLKSNGYFHFKISGIVSLISDDSTAVDLVIDIDEGFPSEIRSIEFINLDPNDSTEITDYFRYLEGEPFIPDEIEFAIDQSLDYFENNAYPFAKVILQSVAFDNDSTDKISYADLKINIDRGFESKIDHVEIIGNDKTSSNVIIRNIRLNKGEPYSQNRINEIPKQLNRLRFFEPVEQPIYYFNSKKEGILQIKIKEKQTNNFDGIIGYVPPSGKETGYFTGKVNISLRNLFGTGRAAAFRWEQLERYTQELELKYLEPWLFGYPFNVNLGLWQLKQDTTYVQRRFNSSVEFLATEDISASLIFATESTIPDASDSTTFTVYNSTTLSTGFNFKFDTRDDVYAPTEGFLFLNTYLFNSKSINGPSQFLTPDTKTELTIQKFEFDFSFFYEIFNRQIAALTLHAREMRGDEFEISDLYKLGGTNTLRGYRENQFLANRLAWSNLEYRYLLTRRSFAFLFFDSGYFLRNEDINKGIQKNEAFKIGYGIGLSIETGIGVLAVSYAIAKGNSFSDGLIHFGIVNEF